jgi:hypothetical protein
MGAILNAPCSAVNILLPEPCDAVYMDDVWQRIAKRVADLPGGRGREVAWLADALYTTQQRVFNWQTRGVPARVHADIARALGWNVSQLLGIEDAPTSWPFVSIEPQRVDRLTPNERAMVELAARNELERIEAMRGKQPNAGK